MSRVADVIAILISTEGGSQFKTYPHLFRWLNAPDDDYVEIKVREKKRRHHKLLDDNTLANWNIYKNANQEAKKAIDVIWVVHYKDLYDKLDIRDDERGLY